MHIAVIIRTFARRGGGAESYAVAVVQQLADRHEIHVFTQETDEPVTGVVYHRIFRLCEKPRWINQLLFAFATWWRTRRGFDVVHSHENTWQGQVQTVHVWPTRHNLLHGRQGWRLALAWLKILTSPRLLTYIWLEGSRIARKPGRQVVAASNMLQEACLQAYPDADISVITPGVEIPVEKLSKDLAWQRLGLNEEGPWLLFVANDYARKGLDALLQAMALLPQEVQLCVVGSRNQVHHYQEKIKQLNLTSRVHFLGPLPDVTPAYQAADILIHPTLEDSYAMVVLEAMANGLPVVVSGPQYCGISRGLRDGQETLILKDPNDAKQLEELIRKVLNDQILVRRMKEKGMHFARTHTWANAAQQYETLYRQAAPQ